MPMEGMRGTAVPKRPGPTGWRGQGVLPMRRSVPMEGLRGTAGSKRPEPTS